MSDWESMEAIEPAAGEQLERTLTRYARLRLEPNPAQARRARSAVMEAAWRARIDTAPAPNARRIHRPFAGWGPRRIALVASAAAFSGLLLGSSVFAASRAGGPLYDARLTLETLTLPSDPAARLQAQIANTQVRLAEAYDAEARHDTGALDAALHAYSVDAALLGATRGPDASQVLAAVEQHRRVLLSLIAEAGPNVPPGLTQALASSDNAIERLSALPSTTGGDDTTGGPSSSGGPGHGATSGSSGGGAGASAAPSPMPTPKPATTPKPPLHTPKPGHTPKNDTVPANTNVKSAPPSPTATPSPSPSAH